MKNIMKTTLALSLLMFGGCNEVSEKEEDRVGEQPITFTSLSRFSDKDNTELGTIGNGDGNINKGEIALFSASFTNPNNTDKSNISVSINGEDSYIEIDNIGSSSDLTIQNINSNETIDFSKNKSGNTDYLSLEKSILPFKVKISDDIPDSYRTKFNFVYKVGNKQWLEPFTFSVNNSVVNISANEISLFNDITNEELDVFGNSDGILNPGESAFFSVAIENSGSSTATDVLISVSEEDDFINVINSTEKSKRTLTINSNVVRDTNDKGILDDGFLATEEANDFKIIASENTPDKHEFNLTIKGSDKFNNSWTTNIPVIINHNYADVVFYKISKFYDKLDEPVRTNGNNDEFLNSFESALFNIAVRNKGISNAYELELNIKEDSDLIEVEKVNKFDTINLSSRGIMDNNGNSNNHVDFLNSTNEAMFLVKSIKEVNSTVEVPISLFINDRFGNEWNSSFTLPVTPLNSELVYFDRGNLFDETNDLLGIRGNDNGRLDANETVRFNIAVENKGFSAVEFLNLELISLNNSIVVNPVSNQGSRTITVNSKSIVDSNNVIFGDTAFLEDNTRLDFSVTSTSTFNPSSEHKMQLIMIDQLGNRWTSEFNFDTESIN
jgi:hypothetical protein